MQATCGACETPVANEFCETCRSQRAPTAAEIRDQCREIRSGWDEATWKERAGLRIFGAKHSREAWRETVADRRDRAVRRVADAVLLAVGAAGDVPEDVHVPVPSVKPQSVAVRLPCRATMPVRSDGLRDRVRHLRANCPKVGTTEFCNAGS